MAIEGFHPVAQTTELLGTHLTQSVTVGSVLFYGVLIGAGLYFGAKGIKAVREQVGEALSI